MHKFFISLFVLSLSVSIYAQNGNFSKLPNVSVKDLRGNTVSSEDFENDGRPIIISFWATWCKPCITELNAINDYYLDWVDETGVKLIAVSIDDARNAARVRPFVLGQGWEYEVYLDENSDLRRALNVNNPPHTFLLNSKREVVWQHNGYVPGDEDILYDLVVKLTRGEPLD